MANPIDNPGFYSQPKLGGRDLPGSLIDCEIPPAVEEWSTVRPIAGTGWTQIYKGRTPVKGIKFSVCLNAEDNAGVKAAYAAHYKFVVYVRGKAPPVYSKPPALGVTFTPLLDAGVRAVVYVSHTPAQFTTGKNLVVYTFDEATKSKLIPIGPPEAAILNETNPSPTTLQGAALVDVVAAGRGPQDPREPPVTVSDLGSTYGTGL